MHSRHAHREDQTPRRSAAAIQHSCHVLPVSPASRPAPASAPPIGRCVTRTQGKSPEATGDPYTYQNAMDSPQRDNWKQSIEEESTSILLKNTFSALNSFEAWQLQVKPFGSNWVYNTKHNSDWSTWHEACIVKRDTSRQISLRLIPLFGS